MSYERDRIPSTSAIPPTIDADPDNVAIEIEAWARKMETVFSGWDRQVSEFASSNYASDGNYKDEFPENHRFEWVDTMRSQFVTGVPQCNLRTMTNDLQARLSASAIKHTINRIARDANWKRLHYKLFMDWAFRRASWMYYRKPEVHLDRGPLDGPVMRPGVMRVPPKRLIYDARALEWEETLLRGHESIISKRTLQRQNPESGWYLDVIEGLQVGAGLEGILSQEQLNSGNRDDVKAIQLWFPDEQLDEDLGPEQGFFGTIRVFAQCERNQGRSHCGNLAEIKAPVAWFGPRTGPYGMSGQHYVPDNVEPLSLFIALEHVAKSMAMRSKTLELAMAQYKTFLLESTGTRNLAMLIKNAKHGGIVKAKGFDKNKAMQYTVGGIDAAMAAHYQFEQQRMDRLSGLTATQRGEITGGSTATAESLAAGGSAARAAGMRASFYEIPTEMFQAMGWIVDGDDQFYTKLPPQVEAETGVGITAMRGGRKDGQSFEDYDVVVEPLSMKYRSEEELRLIADKEIEMMSTLGPLLPQTPWIDWEAALKDIGEAYGIVDLPERFNYQMAEQVAGMMLGAQMQPGSSFQASPPKVAPFNATQAQAGKSGPPGASGARPTGAAQQPRPFGAAAAIGNGAQPSKPPMGGNTAGQKARSSVKKAG